MQRVRLLIFDWDGTLADSAAQIVSGMQHAIAALDWEPRRDEQLRELIGLGLDEVLQQLYPSADPSELRRLLLAYRQQWLGAEMREADLFPGALPALQQLHGAGYGLAVATGKSRRGLQRSLQHHTTLADLLVNSRTADETASKPHPRMLEELLADAGLAPDEALMIGDTEFDLDMARAIGMPAIGVTCGVHAPQRLLGAAPRALLDSVADLPRWLAAARQQAQGSG